jgi:hypothetical protein
MKSLNRTALAWCTHDDDNATCQMVVSQMKWPPSTSEEFQKDEWNTVLHPNLRSFLKDMKKSSTYAYYFQW